MKHLGDITKISGYTAPVVDAVIGGSPCQDLSVAGKRAGLDGKRSGLFMEQLRIIKEMRDNDRRQGRTGVDIRPRYMVWENVPGAFSSNGGEDFRIVLEETAKVADKDASIPRPENGKWTTSGCILADGWSIAWRVLDAQFWGVPQRRRRIALVADFGGRSAEEILFVRKSISGNTEQGGETRERTSSNAERSSGADDSERIPYTGGCDGGGKGALIQADRTGTLSTVQDKTLFQPVLSIENHPADSRVDIDESGKVQTLTSRMGTGGGNVPLVMCFEPGIASREGGHIYEDVSGTLRANAGDNQMATAYPVGLVDTIGGQQESYEMADISHTLKATHYKSPPTVAYAVDMGGGKSAVDVLENKSPTLTTTHYGAPVVALDRAAYNQGKNVQFDIGVSENGIAQTVVAKGPGAVAYGICSYESNIDTSHADDVVRTDSIVSPLQARDYKGGKLIATRYIVRRLTPMECERLQGYPDHWTDIGAWTDGKGKLHKEASDASRYKALGNSIALPQWKWVAKRISGCYERDATMASLFDGIGGFPLVWEQINGKGSCLWASEIEDFPIAVTKARL